MDIVDETKTSICDLPRALRVLLILEVLHVLITFLSPQDAIEFLSIHTATRKADEGWKIMRMLFKIPRELLDDTSEVSYTGERDFILKVVRKYGFSCTDCFNLLDGAKGFFCCTSLCTDCSTRKFNGQEFVDSTVRFYLCGSDNITVRGRAFLVHPFWLSLFDESSNLVSQYGSALRIAQLIYTEKKFFSNWAPQLERPRDDKFTSLLKMVHKEFLDMRAEDQAECTSSAHASECDSDFFKNACSTTECKEADTDANMGSHQDDDEIDHIVPQPTSSTKDGATAVSAIAVSATLTLFHCPKTECEKLRIRIESKWGPHVPTSLASMYIQAFNAMQTETSPEGPLNSSSFGRSTVGTMPLRDLVKSLHVKGGGNVKIQTNIE